MIYEKVSEVVLDSVFLRLPRLLPQANVVLKIEGLNPVGSIKIKTAVGMVEDAERAGLLIPGSRLVESSSGNLGIALSMACAERGYQFTCVTDPNASAEHIRFMEVLGATVVVIHERDPNGGFLGSRIRYIERLIHNDPDVLWLNQYASPANLKAHSERTGRAILKEFPNLDQLFVGAGTAGTLAGCMNLFRRRSPRTRVVAVDAVGSVTFGGVAGKRHIPGLGASKVPKLSRSVRPDEVVHVTERETVAVCRMIAREYGLLVGGSTGSVLAAVLRQRGDIPFGSTVVAISPDLGDRYLKSIYDDAWIMDRELMPEAGNGSSLPTTTTAGHG